MKQLYLHLILVGGALHAAESHWYYNMDGEKRAIGGYDPVSYFNGEQPLQGSDRFVVVYGDVVYHFANQINKKQFELNPERYLPQYGGWCAFAIGVDSEKYGFGAVRFQCDPTSYKVIDEKLYLFAKIPGFDARSFWEQEDQKAMVARGDAFWKSRVELGKKLGHCPQGMNPTAPMETAQFDFFIGSWTNKVKWMTDVEKKTYSGEISGEWNAYYHWDGYGIADDWNQVGVSGSGGPAFRSFDPLTRKWVMTYIPVNQPRNQIWSMEGAFDDKGELHAELEGVDRRGRHFKQRVHFTRIRKDRFLWHADRSYDDGVTWIEKFGIAECVRVKPET